MIACARERRKLRAEVVMLASWAEKDAGESVVRAALSSVKRADGFAYLADVLAGDAAFYRKEAERWSGQAFRIARALR